MAIKIALVTSMKANALPESLHKHLDKQASCTLDFQKAKQGLRQQLSVTKNFPASSKLWNQLCSDRSAGGRF